MIAQPLAAPAGGEPVIDAPDSSAPQPAAAAPTPPANEAAPAPATGDAPKSAEPASDAPRANLSIWATAGWADALGPARCRDGKLEGLELGIKLASTLKRSAAATGVAIAAAGAVGDHPLIAFAAEHDPKLLAQLFKDTGYAALALGIADLNGPLLSHPELAEELHRQGIPVVATNLECRNRAWCRSWVTAEDPLLIIEQGGHRYAFISVLPDDTLTRVEPAARREVTLRSAADTLVERTQEAKAAHVDLVIASIDHGPDPTAAVSLASFVAQLPEGGRPDLVLSPSAAENLLFLRPLSVSPAVAGTRSGTVTWLRVTKVGDADSDVFARGIALQHADPSIAAALERLGAHYCAANGGTLPGGKLKSELDGDDLVRLGALAAREMADADLVVIDPTVFDDNFFQPTGAELQRGQVERAVLLNSRLVVADVSLNWLTDLNKRLDSPRPLALFGAGVDGSNPQIAGRSQVVGVQYRIVTTAVLAHSGRLPDGAKWQNFPGPHATLRGALLAHLSAANGGDPRDDLIDPASRTQWILRTDGQLQGNLTSIKNRGKYEEPALQVDDSRRIGAQLVVNMDGDAPGFLFENAGQIAFDRDFATHTTAQDLDFFQSTYTYRGLWNSSMFYPHPFVEGYVETSLFKGTLAYHHLLLRPELGLRSLFTNVLSLKLSAAFEVEALSPYPNPQPGLGAELVLKPWTTTMGTSSVHLEGNVSYLWISPMVHDQQTLRAQLISAIQIIGPLQFTLTALGLIRKDRHQPMGEGLSFQAGLRLRFIERLITE